MNKACGIEFIGNPKKLCFSGQQVQARAIILVDKPTVINHIAIKIHGTAAVYWSDLEKEGHRDETVYIDEEIPLIISNTKLPLKPGRHGFDFTFTIPLGCPTSFESKRSRIRYVMKLVYVNNYFNIEKSFGFTVIKPLDLNNHGGNLALPFSDWIEKKMWFGLSKKIVAVTVTIPKTGYVPGEFIPVEIFINNKSSSDIWELSTKLVLKAIHRTRSPKDTLIKKITLSQVKYSKDRVGKNQEFKDCLKIPPTPPSYEDTCFIFDVSYFVVIKVTLSGHHSKLKVKIPIVIGSVPLGVSESKKSEYFEFENYNPILRPKIEESPFMDSSKFKDTGKEFRLDMKFIPVFPKFNTKLITT